MSNDNDEKQLKKDWERMENLMKETKGMTEDEAYEYIAEQDLPDELIYDAGQQIKKSFAKQKERDTIEDYLDKEEDTLLHRKWNPDGSYEFTENDRGIITDLVNAFMDEENPDYNKLHQLPVDEINNIFGAYIQRVIQPEHNLDLSKTSIKAYDDLDSEHIERFKDVNDYLKEYNASRSNDKKITIPQLIFNKFRDVRDKIKEWENNISRPSSKETQEQTPSPSAQRFQQSSPTPIIQYTQPTQQIAPPLSDGSKTTYADIQKFYESIPATYEEKVRKIFEYTKPSYPITLGVVQKLSNEQCDNLISENRQGFIQIVPTGSGSNKVLDVLQNKALQMNWDETKKILGGKTPKDEDYQLYNRLVEDFKPSRFGDNWKEYHDKGKFPPLVLDSDYNRLAQIQAQLGTVLGVPKPSLVGIPKIGKLTETRLSEPIEFGEWQEGVEYVYLKDDATGKISKIGFKIDPKTGKPILIFGKTEISYPYKDENNNPIFPYDDNKYVDMKKNQIYLKNEWKNVLNMTNFEFLTADFDGDNIPNADDMFPFNANFPFYVDVRNQLTDIINRSRTWSTTKHKLAQGDLFKNIETVLRNGKIYDIEKKYRPKVGSAYYYINKAVKDKEELDSKGLRKGKQRGQPEDIEVELTGHDYNEVMAMANVLWDKFDKPRTRDGKMEKATWWNFYKHQDDSGFRGVKMKLVDPISQQTFRVNIATDRIRKLANVVPLEKMYMDDPNIITDTEKTNIKTLFAIANRADNNDPKSIEIWKTLEKSPSFEDEINTYVKSKVNLSNVTNLRQFMKKKQRIYKGKGRLWAREGRQTWWEYLLGIEKRKFN